VVGHGFEEDGMDTKFVTDALAGWQNKNTTTRAWDQLTLKEQSEILRDAQELKRQSMSGGK
jgi:hypothetical protein